LLSDILDYIGVNVIEDSDAGFLSADDLEETSGFDFDS